MMKRSSSTADQKSANVDGDGIAISDSEQAEEAWIKVREERRQLYRRDSVRVNDPTHFYSSLVTGVASGALSSVLCAPLDLIRVRIQVWGQVLGSNGQGGGGGAGAATMTKKSSTSTIAVPIGKLLREIRQNEGYRGFFKGLGATLLTVPVFWAIYFPFYDDFKHRWYEHYPETNASLIHMGSAVAAGALSDIVCNPMFVVRTRLQTAALHDIADHRQHHVSSSSSSHNYNKAKPLSIAQTVRSLYKEGGLPIFWRGMTANLIGLSHVAIQFPLYEKLKKVFRGNKRHESALDLLFASSLSKMMASLVSYPHEVVRSRMMDARGKSHIGFVRTCQSIYAQEGAVGFYAGLPITLVRVIPNTCVTFVTYELLLRWTREKIQECRSSGRFKF